MADAFPGKSVWLYKGCIPSTSLSEMHDLAPSYAQAPNYWLPKGVLERDLSDQVLTPAESVIWHLYHSVAKFKVPKECSGAEWWVQVYEEGSGLAFHFDKDEHIYKSEQTGYGKVKNLRRWEDDVPNAYIACTVVLDQRFDSEKGTTDPELPKSCVFVPASAGKYCFFDGRLGHGVLDSSNPERRMTMLINWWTDKPTGIHRPSAEELEKMGRKESRSSTSAILSAPPAAIVPADGVSRVAQLQYPVIRIPSDDEDIKECGILVDDLLDAYLLDAFGEKAFEAVSVWYEGHVLYPIDPSKTKQDISKKLIIPAAFVPAEVEVGP